MRTRTIRVVAMVVVSTLASASYAKPLVGITWDDSWLVSFEPETGTLLQRHTQLNCREDFRGLTYDPTNRLLYAAAQVTKSLYSIDPMSLRVQKIGNLPLPGDVSSLTYDPVSQTLYAAAVNVDESKSQLYSINPSDASATWIGDIPARYINSISYNPDEGLLNAYALYGGISSDSPFKSSVVTIDPTDVSMTTLFETPYHTIMGLARVPGDDTFYAWASLYGHGYVLVDISEASVTMLANSDAVGVISDAMIYRDFDISAIPAPGAALLVGTALACMRLWPRRRRA